MNIRPLVYYDVVIDMTVKTFSEFKTGIQAKIVIYLVIGGAVIKVDSPFMNTAVMEAVVPDNNGFPGIKLPVRIFGWA